jgi:hypothetical protein
MVCSRSITVHYYPMAFLLGQQVSLLGHRHHRALDGSDKFLHKNQLGNCGRLANPVRHRAKTQVKLSRV